jgi:hypothetical protein
MADNDKTILDGFESISNMITGKNVEFDDIPNVEPDDIIDDNEPGDPVDDTDPIIDPIIDPTDDDEPGDDSGRKGDEGEPGDPGIQDDPEMEQMVSQLLQEKLANALNYQFNNVQDVVNYLENLVSEASTPSYSNEEVGKLDEYVRNGGNLKTYLETIYDRGFDINDVDITNESDQKRIIREHLKTQGMKDEMITKRIERYESGGVLDEEALEAQELLKDYTSKKEVKLLETQRQQAEQIKERQREFVTSVEETIDKLTEINGVKITTQDKRGLKEYILKPTPDGMTNYQKDFTAKDKYVQNFIVSAFLTQKGDALVNRAKAQATSDTYKNIQKKLQDKKGNRITGSKNQTSGKSVLDLSRLSSFIAKK